MSFPTPNAGMSAPIDMQRVRYLFSTPNRIAESDFLRKEVASRMRERLELVKIQPARVLDAGCGEGNALVALREQFSDAQIIGMDASSSLLAVAHDRYVTALSAVRRLFSAWLPARMMNAGSQKIDLLCGDFAQLPLQRNSVDLIWSNLALHWHPRPDQVFAEWRRVLTVDGLLMFSCFGPDTFKEVRAAFASVDANLHVLPFVDMHDFGDMLVNAGFSTPVMDMEKITVTYDSVEKLISDVRAWGGNPLTTRRRALMSRSAGRKMMNSLEQSRRLDHKLPLTFEIVYGHAFRPASRKTAAGEAIVRLDLGKK